MLVALASLVPLCVGAPCSLDAQRAVGIVLDASTKLPVADATVALLDADAQELGRARTDGAGRFTILPPESAPYLVLVRRLGYHGFNSAEVVLGRRDTTLVVYLTPSAQRLPPSVTRARGPAGNEWGRDGFMRRRELGAGVFLTRFDVLSQEPVQLEEAFRGVDGLQVRSAGLDLQVRSTRGRGCLKIFMNRLPSRTALSVLPKHVYGIEVYRDIDEVPKELLMEAHPCGLINIWTRAAWAPRPPKVPTAGDSIP
jgi:hypothetical protein